MATAFPQNTRNIKEGSPVSSGNVNAPLNNLYQRTISLKEKIDNAILGSVVTIHEQPVEGQNVLPGMPVYKDTDGIFKPGLASTEVQADGATVALSDKGYIWGVVLYKHSSVLADIVTAGTIAIKENDLKAITVDGEVHTGPLYLSATPGKDGYITHVKPPLGVVIALVQGPNGVEDGQNVYSMLINLGWKNVLEGHIHYHVDLSATVAATKAALGTNKGWIPADDAYWAANGVTAPAAAEYGYVIDNDSSLKNIWPPIPIGAIHYDVDGVAQDVVDFSDDVLIDSEGIWWTSATSTTISTKRHDFYFTRMTFKTSDSLVTSIKRIDNSIILRDKNGDEVAVGSPVAGDVEMGLNIAIDTEESVLTGKAIKEISGNIAKEGPVVDKITTDTPATVALSANTGEVVLSVTAAEGRDGPVDFTELDGAELQEVDGVYYVALGNNDSITGRFRIPTTGISSALDVTINFLLWLRAAGTLPARLDFEYHVISPPENANTPAAYSPSFTATNNDDDLSLGSAVISTNSEKMLASVTIPETVAAGDTIYFRVSRSASDGYSGDIGILSQWWTTAISSE